MPDNRNAKPSTFRCECAIVVQGGAMRGVYSMAALMALSASSFADNIDHAFGSSAGATNTALMLANQAAMGVSIYIDSISNRRFIDLRRIWRIANIDFLIDKVLMGNKPLDVDAVRRSRCLLHIALTDASSGKVRYVTNKDTDIDLMEAFRATMAMPILFNKQIRVGDGMYFDGGIVEPVPVLPAIEEGCSHIVVILTRPFPFAGSQPQPSLLFHLAEMVYMRSFPPATRHAITQLETSFDASVDAIRRASDPDSEVRLSLICPEEGALPVTRTTTDRKSLIQGALYGWRDTSRVLDLSLTDEQFVHHLGAFVERSDIRAAIGSN